MKVFARTLAALLVLCLIFAECGMLVSSANAEEIDLPTQLQIIEEEAFYGNTSLDRVILPDGLEEIHRKAFANSSCRDVYFPSSISYIAPNAFDNCPRLVGHCVPHSYAAAFLESKGFTFFNDGEEESQDFTIPEILDAWQSDPLIITVIWRTVPTADWYYLDFVDAITGEKETVTVSAAENTNGDTVTGANWFFDDDSNDNKIYLVTVRAKANGSLLSESSSVIVELKKDIAVTNISLSESRITLRTGNTKYITATVSPANAYNKRVIWTSSDENVAVVEDGLVTAVSKGTATITATTEDGNCSATCNVTVEMQTVDIVVLKNGGGKAGLFTWFSIPDAVSYNLYYKTSTTNWTMIENITVCSYEFHLDNQPGSWTFAVAGVAADGSEGDKGIVDMEGLTLSGKPAITVEDITSTTATISWDPVDNAEFYYVYYCQNQDDAIDMFEIRADEELRCTIPGLIPSQTYDIIVDATPFDGVGTGSCRDRISITTTGTSDDEFIVKKGSSVIIGNGQNSGTFACGTAAGYGDIATFTVSSNSIWTVSSNADWMTVRKTNDTTAVVTIGDVEDGLQYNANMTFRANGNNYIVTITLDKTSLSDRFVVTKGSDTILALGERTGYFTCGASAGYGDISTFTVSSSNYWTVNNNGAPWMTVRKKNSTTAIMTVGDVEDGQKYTGTLTFTTDNGIYKVYVTLDKTDITNAPSFSGRFAYETKTISLGDSWIVEGSVSMEGGSGSIGKITVNALGVSGSNLTDDFTGHGYSSVKLNEWKAYTIDTTAEPWNHAGTYTLRLWAKDTDGVGGFEPIATMTVKVVEKNIITAPSMTNILDGIANSAISFIHEYSSNHATSQVAWSGYSSSYNLMSCHDTQVNNPAKGTKIYAPLDGTIVYYQYFTDLYKDQNHTLDLISYGNHAVFTSSDGKYRFVFAHMDSLNTQSLVVPDSDNTVHMSAGDVSSRAKKLGKTRDYYSYTVASEESRSGNYNVWYQQVGQVTIAKGTLIGTLGCTGNAGTSSGKTNTADWPHLHIEVYYKADKTWLPCYICDFFNKGVVTIVEDGAIKNDDPGTGN